MPRNDNIIGISFEADITDLKKGLSDAKKSLELTNSEFSKATAGMDKWQKTTEGLSAKVRQLTSSLNDQKAIVDNYRKAYELVVDQYGANSEEAQKMLTVLNKEEAKYERMNTQLGKYQNQLRASKVVTDSLSNVTEKLGDVNEKAKKEFEKTTKSMVDWKTNADGLRAKIKQLNTVIPEQSNHVKELERQYKNLSSQEGDNEEALKDLQNEWRKQSKILNDLKSDVNKYENELDDLEGTNKKVHSTTKELSDGFTVLKGTMANLIASGLQKVVSMTAQAVKSMAKLGAESIQLASDIEESQNVVDVTFGNNAKVINDFAKNAGKNFGMTSLSAKKFTGTLGAMVKSMGLTDDQVLDMSTSLVGLAGDMASFYNLDHEEAFEKIRSGISGETEPLKQLGINMSVANLEAYALSQGIKKAYDSMTQAEQATLRYNYLMSVTADAQGDFARTSDGFANQMRIAELNIENVKIALGEKLLPIINKVVKAFNDWIDGVDFQGYIEGIGDRVNWLVSDLFPFLLKLVQGLVKAFKDYGPQILAVATAFLAYNTVLKISNSLTKEGTALYLARIIATKTFTTVTQLATGATTLATVAQKGLNLALKSNPIGLVISLVSALGIGLVAWAKKTEENAAVQGKSTLQTEKNIKAIKEEKQAREELMETQNEQMQTNLNEMQNVQNLNSELKTLVDENGKVKKGYENRASFIVNELSTALGIEISLVDGQIQNYKKMQDEIDKTILKKKAEIILSAQEEAYTNAINERTKALDKQRQYAQELKNAEDELRLATENYNSVLSDPRATETDRAMAYSRMMTAQGEKQQKEKQYNDQEDLIKSYYDDIATYEQNATLLASDNAEDWKKVIDSVSTSYKDGEEKIEVSLANQVMNQQLAVIANKKLLDQDVRNGINANDSKYKAQVEAGEKRLKELANELIAQTSTINKNSPDVVNAWKSLATDSESTFNEIIKDLPPELQKTIKNMVYTVDTDGDGIKDSFEAIAEESASRVANKKEDFRSATKTDLDSARKGVEESTPKLHSAIDSAVVGMTTRFDKQQELKRITESDIDSAKQGVENGTPTLHSAIDTTADGMVTRLDKSEEAKTAGKNFVKGAKKGIEDKDEQNSIFSAVWKLGQGIVSWLNGALGNHSPSHIARKSLVYFVKGAELGLNDEKDKLINGVKSMGRDVVKSFNNEIDGTAKGLRANIQASTNFTSDMNQIGINRQSQPTQVVNNFYQTNNSPKALSRLEIYRQTKNLQKMYSR